MSNRCPGPAPVANMPEFVLENRRDREDTARAAKALSNAFVWVDHPWGDEFWQAVYEELDRLATAE